MYRASSPRFNDNIELTHGLGAFVRFVASAGLRWVPRWADTFWGARLTSAPLLT
jgi:hypothetical protein